MAVPESLFGFLFGGLTDDDDDDDADDDGRWRGRFGTLDGVYDGPGTSIWIEVPALGESCTLTTNFFLALKMH